jgi:heterodisulfide reductase subunit A-like polyferredoxin
MSDKKERIGVYVCHCGSNIAGTVDVEDVSRWAGDELEDAASSFPAITNLCVPPRPGVD